MTSSLKETKKKSGRNSLGNDDLMRTVETTQPSTSKGPQTLPEPEELQAPEPSQPSLLPAQTKTTVNKKKSKRPRVISNLKNDQTTVTDNKLDLNDMNDYALCESDFKMAIEQSIKSTESFVNNTINRPTRSKTMKKKRKKKQKSVRKRKRSSVYDEDEDYEWYEVTSDEDDDSFIEDDDLWEEEEFSLAKVLRTKSRPESTQIKPDKNWEELKRSTDLYDTETFDEQFYLKKYKIKKCQVKLIRLNSNLPLRKETGATSSGKKKILRPGLNNKSNQKTKNVDKGKKAVIEKSQVKIKTEPKAIETNQTKINNQKKARLFFDDDDDDDQLPDISINDDSNKKENTSFQTNSSSQPKNSTSSQKQRLLKEKFTN